MIEEVPDLLAVKLQGYGSHLSAGQLLAAIEMPWLKTAACQLRRLGEQIRHVERRYTRAEEEPQRCGLALP